MSVLEILYESPAADPLLRAALRLTSRGIGISSDRTGIDWRDWRDLNPRDAAPEAFLVDRFLHSPFHVTVQLLRAVGAAASLTGVFAEMLARPGPTRALCASNAPLSFSCPLLFDACLSRVLARMNIERRHFDFCLEEADGWVIGDGPPPDDLEGSSFFRLSGDALEICVGELAGPPYPHPHPGVDVSQVRSLALYGDATSPRTDAWLPDLLARLPDLEAFAAIRVHADARSFDCLRRAELPALHTVAVQVLPHQEEQEAHQEDQEDQELLDTLRGLPVLLLVGTPRRGNHIEIHSVFSPRAPMIRVDNRIFLQG
jgi:hypothetical protein